MNKKILILFTCIILINLSEGNAFKKIHNNNLYFTNGIHSATFIAKDHCISRGQPFGTPIGSPAAPATNKGHVITLEGNKKGIRGINIKAGRHGSKNVVNCTADLFSSEHCPFNKHFTFYGYKKHNPRKLNFSVIGTLTINGITFDDIILAQGHGIRNNWWFGGKNCVRFGDGERSDQFGNEEKVNCTATNNKTVWCFYRGRTSDSGDINNPDHVTVYNAPCERV